MKIFDVSLTIRKGMPVWPGDDKVELIRMAKIEDGANANVSFLSMSVHTGTHVDAPYHFLTEGSKVDEMPLDMLVGPVQVVEIAENAKVIDAEVLSSVKFFPNVERIIFKTMNSRYWGSADDSFQTQFVGITQDGAEVLVKKGFKLVGIDYLSIAPYKMSRPTHEVLLKSEMVIIEGLDLREVDAGLFTLFCLPLKLENADGAPARVILIQD